MKANYTIDANLVKQYLSGDKQALAKLVKRWHKSFCKKAYWIVKDKEIAKDIAQDSWGIRMKQIPKLKELEKFGTWASRIVYNKALDWTRVKVKERKKNVLFENQ